MAEVRNIDTRERILDAAERLFMAHGYEGTSMRQITGDAAVNLAAVNYHFGSKESLMQEVFRRRLDWLNEERMRVLEEMEVAAAGKPLKPSQIVDGFFGTLLRMAGDEKRGGMTFLRLLGKQAGDAADWPTAYRYYAESLQRFRQIGDQRSALPLGQSPMQHERRRLQPIEARFDRLEDASRVAVVRTRRPCRVGFNDQRTTIG